MAAESMEDGGERRRASVGEMLLWSLLALAIATLIYFAAAERMERSRAPELPILGNVPPFSLENRDGRKIGLADLEGKPFLVDFVFTRCPGACPVLSKRMAELSRELPMDRVNLVSLSVDPEHDRPAVLEAYAAKQGAPAQWYFLTGAKAEIYGLIRDGFKLLVDDSQLKSEGDPIVHSNSFVLVDRQGRIRGYYNAFDADALLLLRQDLARLLR